MAGNGLISGTSDIKSEVLLSDGREDSREDSREEDGAEDGAEGEGTGRRCICVFLVTLSS